MPAKVIVYSKANCPYCGFAKELLDNKKVHYEEIRIDLDETQRNLMEQKSGRRTVPQIFINDQPIGGFDDLSALEKQANSTLYYSMRKNSHAKQRYP